MDEKTKLPKSLGTAEQMYGRLHDTALEGAMARFIAGTGRQVVGFMGGHDIDRDKPIFRTVAMLARELARKDFLVISGGGPGLMEAANLGAFLTPYADGELDKALAILAKVPKFDSTDGWLETACQVREHLLKATWDSEEDPASVNIGIPTWLYGHEPPNMFATHAAKLFYNSLREDGLVTIAGAGLVFGRGNAGTVQEIFQDATQNYYRAPGVAPTPMALLEADFWTRPAEAGPDPIERKKPLQPLLTALAKEKPKTDWSAAVLITDDASKVVELIAGAAKKAAATAELSRADLWLRRHVNQ
jgi:predicted Rossmann-fold nucleotide-binding protein